MKNYQSGGSTPEMTPAELAAFRLNKGKSTIDLLKEDKEKTIRKKMESMPPMTLPEPGAPRPGVSMSEESRKMIDDTNKGYEYTKKRDYAKGGSVGSASKRADGCAVRGKTKGMMR
jgi:hypothetical protein